VENGGNQRAMASGSSGPVFTLDVDADFEADIIHLRLTDEHGRQLGANQVRVAEHSAALWQGLFDTGSYVRTYSNSVRFTDRPATASDLLEQVGVFLGEKVLGPGITAALHAGVHHRSLVVRQPEALEDRLEAAFARVPWEIARPVAGQAALFERNLGVRMETPGAIPAYAPPPPGLDEPLRVLLVYAEAPGSRPLAMRLEREQLLELFHDEVMPQRRVSVDVLCHGVTRDALREKVRAAGGYHVVHWSGHGHHSLLDLVGEDGRADALTGAGLVELFEAAGGFIPQVVFLSACFSGTLVEDRADPPKAEPERVEKLIEEQPGYTGTALALLGAGVPQLVAMRYEVGDAYARDLAGCFYRRLLADTEPKAPASALALARGELLDRQATGYTPADHATPLLFGREADPLPVPQGRSAALAFRRPQPQPLLADSRELDRPAELVGRGRPLSRLRRCLEEGQPAVAVIQGLAGLGKTALVAEAIHLWHRRFDGVFAFQSKPLPLSLDDFLRRLDERLALHSQPYRELCEQNPYARIYLPPSLSSGKPLSGEARWRQMRENLLEAMRGERLLLVIDNFETHLERVAGEGGYACADPEWDRLLRHLAEGLPGSGSRLVVTSRHRLAALADPERALWLALGPLPREEAKLFLQGSEALRRLAFGDEDGRKLAHRLLEVSRGHPLILTRLGALAGDWEALSQALAELETRGLDNLPGVFASHLSEADRERERAYLEDVAIGSVDLLIRRVPPRVRKLLWLVTLAAEPTAEAMIQKVCTGGAADAPSVLPLLAELTGAGLLTVERRVVYGFHELVRERIDAWMAAHPEEKGRVTEEYVWEAYGASYAAKFEALRETEGEGSREQTVEAGRRGLSYLVRARAFDRLGSFASQVVNSTRDPQLLARMIAELKGIVGQAPAGEARWGLRAILADALRQGGGPDAAVPFYEEAVAEAEEAAHWNDVCWICQNWAMALSQIGRLDDAKSTYLRSAGAAARAGSPRVYVLAGELEALRVDVMRGKAERALPEIESRLHEVQAWWEWHRAGEPVPEAPDTVPLARTLIGSLDIARQAYVALERWEAALRLAIQHEEILGALGEVEHELALARLNQHGPLLRLGRLDEAQSVIESCLEAFRHVGDLPNEAKALSALADLWNWREDCEQAAGLERQALAVRNRFSDLVSRSISHGNLAVYLDLVAAEEAARHRLARIAYVLVTGHGPFLAMELYNLAILMRRAAASGGRYELPRLAELLARPEFEPLQRTLAEWNVALDGLQAQVDQHVEEVRRQVAAGG